MKVFTTSKKYLLLKSLVATLVLFGITTVALPPKAAAVNNNINNVPGFVQTQMYNADLANCNSFKHAQFIWLSAAGDNGVTTVTLNQGQDSVGLWLNTLAGHCNNNIDGSGNIIDTQIRTTRTRTTNATTNLGYISSGLIGSVADLSYTPSHFFNTKYVTGPYPSYDVLRTDFTVSGLAGLGIGLHQIDLQVDTTLVNEYVRPNGTTDYICVTPNGDGTPHFAVDLNGMGTDGIPCGQAGPTFSIFVNIVSTDQQVNGNIDRGGCDIGVFTATRTTNNQTYSVQAGLIGWAQDPDFYYTQVHVYIQGVNPNDLNEQVFVGSYDANNYPRSINGTPIVATVGYGQPGYPSWHDWFVVPKADLDQFADAYTHTIRAYGIGRNPDGSANGNNREIAKYDGTRLSIGPCAPPTCTAVTDPAPVEPGVNFNIILSYIYNAGAQGRPIAPTGSVSFNGGPVSSFLFQPPAITGRSHSFGPYTHNVNGTFTINGSVAQAGVFSVSCNNSNVHIANRPYVKVYGNDVSVGGKFADTTTPNSCSAGASIPDPLIWAFDKKVSVGSEDYYGGGGSQFGASALGKIDSFFSAGARNGQTEPKPAVGLSFGNMLNNTKVTNYGGDSGLQRCIPNYYSASTQPGADVRPGGTTITSADAPSPNQQKAIFVNGDAYISGSINYPSNTWANISQIPSLYLIVKGNIYIDDSVTNLDGVYVAQPDNSGNRGTIFTCTNGSSLYTANQLYDSCRTKLTVTGSFIANQVKYLRTNGTVGLSIPNGPPANPQLQFGWSSAGPISDQYCVQLLEIADPNTWNDNYICSAQDHGLQFRSNGTIPGMTCINLVQPPSYAYSGTWADNYLCWPPAANLGLTWSINGQVAGRYCLPKIEEIGGWHPQTYLCEPLKTNPPYTAVNELASSGNIAEVFNFSQELYLAPAPTILQTVIGPASVNEQTRYESITSLPPIL